MTATDNARAEAYAAHIRNESERMIRAHAHRLVAGHRAALRTMTAERRRDELLALAEKVTADDLHADELVAAVLPYLSDVTNATCGFDVLVQAVRERGEYIADPDEWMARHGLPVGDQSWVRMDDSTLAQVDEALDALIGITP